MVLTLDGMTDPRGAVETLCSAPPCVLVAAAPTGTIVLFGIIMFGSNVRILPAVLGWPCCIRPSPDTFCIVLGIAPAVNAEPVPKERGKAAAAASCEVLILVRAGTNAVTLP